MIKLLAESFRRLIKAKIFWLGAAFSVVFSLFLCYANYNFTDTSKQITIDEMFFTFYVCFCLVCAVVISLFIGAEYSDGTIRNKLIIGHNRAGIYFANLITCIVASSTMIIIHTILTLSVGYLLYEKFQMETSRLIFALVCIFLISAVYSAMCVMIAMNCHNKAITAVATILLMIILVYIATLIGQKLLEPEMTYDGIVISQNGIEYGDIIKNTAYVSGTKRKIYEFIYSLLPTGQIQQMYSLDFENSSYWPMMSLSLFTILSAVGAVIFKKKDLK